MTKTHRTISRMTALSLTAAVAVAMAGCSDGVELNGKVFDAMGISASSQANSKKEPVLAQRSGIVLPPDQNRLPEPGSAASAADAQLATLNDPDRKKVMAAAERERLHKAYCAGDISWKERVYDNAKGAQANQSPYGPCTTIGQMLKQ